MLQGLHEVSSAAAELEESNALALAIVAPGNRQASEPLQFSEYMSVVPWIQTNSTPETNILLSLVAQAAATHLLPPLTWLDHQVGS